MIISKIITPSPWRHLALHLSIIQKLAQSSKLEPQFPDWDAGEWQIDTMPSRIKPSSGLKRLVIPTLPSSHIRFVQIGCSSCAREPQINWPSNEDETVITLSLFHYWLIELERLANQTHLKQLPQLRVPSFEERMTGNESTAFGEVFLLDCLQASITRTNDL